MTKPFHIVLTTIRLPTVLTAYFDNIRRYDHLDEVKIWIVGDMKTPPETAGLARNLSGQGLETVFLDIAAQDRWGERFPAFYAGLPYNNETRRNIGYLRALADGCRVLISIDDDNFPDSRDFIAGHRDTGRARKGPLLQSATGFYNVCRHLELDSPRKVYPRGFPLSLRDGAPHKAVTGTSVRDARVGVKAGLWTGAPDLDAVTWLNGAVTSRAYLGNDCCLLAHHTWIPVNNQNVSVVRDLIPAFLCVPMGWKVPGGRIERYGDIWGGYFLQAVMQSTCFHVAFGRPVVDHRRNEHDYPADLRREYWGLVLTDWLVDILKNRFQSDSRDIPARVLDLAGFLRQEAAPSLPEWCPEEMKVFLTHTAGNLAAWARACQSLL